MLTLSHNSQVRQLARRLAHLESLFQATNPGLMPKDTPALPSTKPSPASLSADFNSPTSSFARRPTLQDETLLESNEGGLAIDDEDAATRQSHSDTEDAAANLEDVTFGARVPVLRAISTASQNTATLKSLKQGTGLELTSALTSILAEPLSYDQDGRPRSAVRLGMDLAISTVDLPLSRSGAMAQIFAVLPGRDISDFLIAKVCLFCHLALHTSLLTSFSPSQYFAEVRSALSGVSRTRTLTRNVFRADGVGLPRVGP